MPLQERNCKQVTKGTQLGWKVECDNHSMSQMASLPYIPGMVLIKLEYGSSSKSERWEDSVHTVKYFFSCKQIAKI